MKTDYEEFWNKNDGSINPKDALTEAAKVLIHHLCCFLTKELHLEADEIVTESYDEEIAMRDT
jgi:DNA-directed RNA polymerase subunit alpha